MAQSSDLVVPNTSAAGVRSAINTRLQALGTQQSGATAPATTYPYQFWADTTAGQLKIRNSANSAFVVVGTLDVANLGLAPLASPTFTGTPAAPTAGSGTNTTQLATTAFVQAALAQAQPVLMTSQASTSGTSIDFTGIPSTAKRITILFNDISTNGSSTVVVRLGTSGGVVTSGYNSRTMIMSVGTTPFLTSETAGFAIQGGDSASLRLGRFVLHNLTGNTWMCSGTSIVYSWTYGNMHEGALTLSGTLDRIRITTINGTDTFDAGTINVMYE